MSPHLLLLPQTNLTTLSSPFKSLVNLYFPSTHNHSLPCPSLHFNSNPLLQSPDINSSWPRSPKSFLLIPSALLKLRIYLELLKRRVSLLFCWLEGRGKEWVYVFSVSIIFAFDSFLFPNYVMSYHCLCQCAWHLLS
ncbi:hypothetical protein OIU78_010830 [Salix suchowensis]|nr:hypothetical protein OIU78_010830 [Salix suchowensis]